MLKFVFGMFLMIMYVVCSGVLSMCVFVLDSVVISVCFCLLVWLVIRIVMIIGSDGGVLFVVLWLLRLICVVGSLVSNMCIDLIGVLIVLMVVLVSLVISLVLCVVLWLVGRKILSVGMVVWKGEGDWFIVV